MNFQVIKEIESGEDFLQKDTISSLKTEAALLIRLAEVLDELTTNNR